MAEYLIRVADERGHVQEKLENGLSELEVRDRFQQQGFLVYSVKPRRASFSGEGLRRRRIKLEELVIFNSQFVTLIRAGLPIMSALELLTKLQRNQFFRSLLQNVRERVKSGELLSEAFAAQNVFSRLYTTTILAGEKSGNLEEVLSRYVAFQRVTLTFRKKLIASLVYPTLLVIAVTVMVTFLITYVVPQFATLYDQLHANLPPITSALLAAGVIAQHYLPVIVVVLVLLVVGLRQWTRSESGARQFDAFRLKMPLLGQVWLKYQVANFARMMATLLAGGSPLVPSLETAASSMDSKLMSAAIVGTAQAVKEGRPLALSLQQTGVFPELATEMIEVGESTGALPSMLTSVAEFYEEDVQNALTAALSLIEPIILVVMGVIVAGVLIALYLPIFSLGATGIPR